MNVAYQIAISGAAIVALLLAYCRVAEVADIEEPEWVQAILGSVLLLAGTVAPLGVLVGVWL